MASPGYQVTTSTRIGLIAHVNPLTRTRYLQVTNARPPNGGIGVIRGATRRQPAPNAAKPPPSPIRSVLEAPQGVTVGPAGSSGLGLVAVAGWQARKSSPSHPLQRPTREKVRPARPLQRPTREKVLPARPLQHPTREKVLPARPLQHPTREKVLPASVKRPILGCFERAGRTFSRSHPPPDHAGRTFSRSGRTEVVTVKPTTPLQPLIQASVKPPSPMLAHEQHPLKPATPMQAKNAPKTPNSHSQRRWRFHMRLGLCPQR